MTRQWTYKAAGVDIDAGNELVERIKRMVARCRTDDVVSSVGGFSGLVRLPGAPGAPLLAASTDGVGTKLRVAFATGCHNTVGIDLVAMSVNDLLAVGARPLFFLDYFATGHLDVDQAEAVIDGVVRGCDIAGCALLGGETAEMPDMYAAGEYDLAGFAVGIVQETEIIDGRDVVAGDVVIGLPSTGLHSNGYSLARRVLDIDHVDLKQTVPDLGCSLGEALIAPTTIYTAALQAIRGAVAVKAIAHITGGGLLENPPRTIPETTAFVFDSEAWEVPPIFRLIQERGAVADEEMWRTFNMGIGMTLAVAANSVEHALRAGEPWGARVIGRIVQRSGAAVTFTRGGVA